MGVEVVQRVAREAAEPLLKLELLLVTVQSSLPLEQHALLVGPLRAQHFQCFFRNVYLGHGYPSSSLATYTAVLQTLALPVPCNGSIY